MQMPPAEPFQYVIAFDEADAEGIVFFGNYFRLAHRALEHFLPQMDIAWEEWFANPEFAIPLRHVEADYFQPLKPGHNCSVVVRVAEVGESSVSFVYDIRSAQALSLAAQLKTVHVFVSRETFAKAQVPVQVALRLTRALSTSCPTRK